jgi:hypothetical protein
MSDRLFKKIYNKKTLLQAWHLSRVDLRGGFIQDPYYHNDFAMDIENQLSLISKSLKDGTYHPRGLLRIDVPKDTLSVRPGSVVDIRDLVVLYGIIILIAPKLDKLLPETVFSYRYKPDKKRKSLFKETKILEYTFLKKKTIKIKIDIFDPWYEQWPMFIEKSVFAYEKEGFKFLSISDISAYFENIHLDILRELLLKYFPKDQKIVNLLVNILEHWTWPTKHLRTIRRGIPQGNSVSSFIGNIYLLPLDIAFKEFSKRSKIKYYRYMDDVKIFSKTPQTAIKSILEMNEVLRELHLNIQHSKTALKKGKEISEELVDGRLNKVNQVIEEIQKEKLSKEKREEIVRTLIFYNESLQKNTILSGKDLRLFRRIITGFMFLQDRALIEDVLTQIKINPDARMTKSAVNYLSLFPDEKIIAQEILTYLESAVNLFAYQEAWLLKILRFSSKEILKVQAYAKKTFKNTKKHWHVRCKAINILSNSIIKPVSFDRYLKLYENESEPEVKRTLIKLLCQLDSNRQHKALISAVYDPYYKINNLGKMLLMLRQDKEKALQELRFMFNDFSERKLIENVYKLGVIRFNKNREVIKKLKDYLLRRPVITSRFLRLKMNSIAKDIGYKQLKIENRK